MRRQTRQTAISLLLALVFPWALGADLYGLHRCPHHDASAAGELHGRAAAPPARAHGGGASGAVHHGGEHDSGPEGPCTCVGACHASASTPAVAPPPAFRVVLAVVVRPLPSAAPALRARSLPAYFLPLANAPPGSA